MTKKDYVKSAKLSAKKKAGKRAATNVRGAKPVTAAQKTPAKAKPAKAAKAPVDWAAAGRKTWETRQRNLARGLSERTDG